MHRQFASHWNPTQAFNEFCHNQWTFYDKNADGRISYDEFVEVVNEVMNR